MAQDFEIRAKLPLDETGNVMQVGIADHVQIVALTTGGWQHIPVPQGTSQAEVWALASGAATTIAWMYGGARAGAPATGITVQTGQIIVAQCAGAPYLYAKAVGAAADLQIKWIRKDI